MHTAFLVLAPAEGGAIAPWQLELARSPHPPGLHFTPTRHVVWSAGPGAPTVGFWQGGIGGPPDAPCERWVVDERGFVASTGHLRWRGQPWLPEARWAASLAERLRAGTVESVVADLHGVFTVVELTSDGTGAVASDPLGFGFVFRAETPDAVALSSRAELCAHAVTRPPAAPERDALGVCRLAYSRHWTGLRTGFTAVRLCAPGEVTRLRRGGGVVAAGHPRPWQPPDRYRALPPEELLSIVREEIADSVRAALGLPGPGARCDLTGGKDTRLVAAVILGEGLADAFTFQTFGPPTLPDVQVATELAARFGLRHEIRFERRSAGAPYAREAHRFVAATAGMVNLWNLKGSDAPWPEVRITGLSGYLLRSKGRVGPGARTEADLVRAFDAMGFGRARLLVPDVYEALRAEALDDLLGDPGGGSLMDRFDAFDLRASQRHLLGPLDELERDLRVKPLTSAAAVHAAWALGAEARFAERIHVELIRRYSDDLAGYPFAGGRWRRTPRDLVGLGRDTAGDAPGTRAKDQLVSTLQGSAFAERSALLRELFEDRANPVWDLVDRRRALELLDRFGELHPWQRAELFGAATAAMWMGGP